MLRKAFMVMRSKQDILNIFSEHFEYFQKLLFNTTIVWKYSCSINWDVRSLLLASATTIPTIVFQTFFFKFRQISYFSKNIIIQDNLFNKKERIRSKNFKQQMYKFHFALFLQKKKTLIIFGRLTFERKRLKEFHNTSKIQLENS